MEEMPGLGRKLLIFAADNGVFIQQATNLKDSNRGRVIEYGTNRILARKSRPEGVGAGLEAHGIVGLLNLVTTSYLIAITRREEAAQIWGKAVFKVTDVTLIPLRKKEEAERAISTAQRALQHEAHLAYGEGEGEEDVGDALETASDDENAAPKREREEEAKALEPPKKATTFVKDVVQDKGKYGRFATKWFSRNGSQESARRSAGLPAKDEGEGEELTKEQSRQMGEALPDDATKEATAEKESVPESTATTATDRESTAAPDKVIPKKQSAIEHLAPRILRSTRLYFSSSGFYFSYDLDISTSLAKQEPASSTPLWKRFDSLYFWNRNLMNPFISADQDSLVLPLMQGFIGQRSFTIAEKEGEKSDVVAEASGEPKEAAEEKKAKVEAPTSSETTTTTHDFLLTLISRRSIKRAGLRYLRRGVDDEGAVANNVETEQILSPKDWDESQKTFSLIQIRGSMPMFFSQSPYSFKPVPVFFGSEATNQTAFKKHFQSVLQRYGGVQCVSLVDKKPPENTIGELYEKHAKIFNENGGVDSKQIGFEWFDFHGICKGMRFENVKILMDALQHQLDSFGWNEKQNGSVSRRQQGVLRTNCMDCLDRTNVVQSAVAGWALQQQLTSLGLSVDLQTDPKTKWFNQIWADNGDACSKQYAGTSALKGDFTRTRKRNFTGALTDFSLTLTRYYNNIFGDYFLQTNIDYYLGNASPSVFDEFETDMMSQDYALDMRNLRQNAIDTCIKIVLEDPEEDLLSGWTLSCPAQGNTLRTVPFEECVLLLTDKALYSCRFDWDTEKVGSFERVDLRDVTSIWRGAYITSALGGTHLDVERNVGFALRYESKGPAMLRTNTRSLDAEEVVTQSSPDTQATTKQQGGEKTFRLLAFKALPPNSVAAKDEQHDLSRMSEGQTIQLISSEIQRALAKKAVEGGKAPEVEDRDLISVAEAKKSTTYIESLGYSLKRLVWS